jgi:hypothetical protein
LEISARQRIPGVLLLLHRKPALWLYAEFFGKLIIDSDLKPGCRGSKKALS